MTLAAALNVKPEEMDGLTRRLNAMERDGQIKPDRGGNYKLTHSPDFIEGRVSSHRDGFGFLLPEDGSGDIFLPEKEMQKVLHGDRVQARIIGTDRRGRPEGACSRARSARSSVTPRSSPPPARSHHLATAAARAQER